MLDRLIDLRNASYVNLCGLTLTETTSGDNMHRTGLDGYGAQLPTPGWPYAGEAIHLRDTHHVTIEGNRIHTVGGNALYLEGYNSRNEIRGNEVADCGANGITLIGTADRHQNLHCVAGGRWAIHDELADGRTAAEHLTLAEWQKRGFDRHSSTGDPLFAAPSRGDYSLLPDSPAHALGIVGIDQGRIGPRSGRAP